MLDFMKKIVLIHDSKELSFRCQYEWFKLFGYGCFSHEQVVHTIGKTNNKEIFLIATGRPKIITIGKIDKLIEVYLSVENEYFKYRNGLIQQKEITEEDYIKHINDYELSFYKDVVSFIYSVFGNSTFKPSSLYKHMKENMILRLKFSLMVMMNFNEKFNSSNIGWICHRLTSVHVQEENKKIVSVNPKEFKII